MDTPEKIGAEEAHLGATVAAPKGEPCFFAFAGSEETALFMPSTANPKDGTIDCVWYAGATVPRIDYETGDPYMLKLDMAGARLDRLNAGAPIFDSHMTGSDVASMLNGKLGIRAQLGVVQKAWSEGDTGRATLKFDIGGQDGAEMFRKVSSRIVRNLSFGTWIYKREKTVSQAEGQAEDPTSSPDEIGTYTATDWEPFEISPCAVPADYGTTFLSAQTVAATRENRASAQPKERPVENQTTTTQATGAESRPSEEQLNAARIEAAKLERERITEIRKCVSLAGLTEAFADELVNAGTSLDEVRKQVFTKLEEKGQDDLNGKQHRTNGHSAAVTRDARDTFREKAIASILLRHDPRSYKDQAEKGREFVGFSLLDMARECLQMAGVNPRGMNRSEIAGRALMGPAGFGSEYFGVGAQSTSDFPAILANVANKTLRQAYEAAPRTFQGFCRQVTAADFKPINRTQLSDAPALQPINELGEYHRASLTDSNQTYSLATFGQIIAITRKVIINDDLQAFTRVSGIQGVSAARLESDTVWKVITGNQTMTADNTALFHANHKNLFTGGSTALGLTALGPARSNFRQQTAPQGTPMNLTPQYLLCPTVLETTALQLVAPIQLAAASTAGVVPDWVRNLTPVVEPRLDASSTTAWYLVANPAEIDTIEYCYLEGQEGVYMETRQGFDVDGVEMKARLDFAAAAIDFRGLQKQAGA